MSTASESHSGDRLPILDGAIHPDVSRRRLIDNVKLPEGLRSLSEEELVQVASEVREELIDTVSSVGGHFASSLGATELSVVLHHAFCTPEDKLIWDVGHQGYVHKMLTGRLDRLASIRSKEGLSGFLRRDESAYDAFGAGHAGTSISAAVGMRVALDKAGKEDNYVVSVIGDGSMTCGMAFEALNHAGALQLKNFIVVLNDNEMSISPNVGALKWLFSRALTSSASNYARSGIKSLYERGYLPDIVYKAIDRAEDVAQGFIASPALLFASFGFRYIGPVDGHNIHDLTKAIQHARSQDIPVLVHAHTKKGKGYQFAEEDPVTWHAVQLFDRSKGTPLTPPPLAPPPPSYTKVFAQAAIRIAEADEKVVAITAAMAGGTGLDAFEQKYPNRFYDVGICEQHAVTFAAGLACEGIKPICAIYSTFLQRAYDQVLHDVCIQKLPVVFAMDRAGVVGNDGETHQGVFDIAYLRTIPEITLMCPSDENELQHMLYTAVQHKEGPTAIRYPRGNGIGTPLDKEFTLLPIGKGRMLERGTDVLFIALGPTVATARRAASELRTSHGISASVLDARFVKPLDSALIQEQVGRHSLVCTVEDHALAGGFGSAVLEDLSTVPALLATPVLRFGVRDEFVGHASQAEQRSLQGYDSKSIVQAVVKSLRSHLVSTPKASVG
jgi:1-deoxy-D-xylulose-5-phosphate synthase